MAAEFIAYFEVSNHGIWLKIFIIGLRVVNDIERPYRIYYDNESGVQYSNNNRIIIKSKFIDIKFLTVKERVQNIQIFIKYKATNSMLADLLIKALVSKIFHKHTAYMSVILSNILI